MQKCIFALAFLRVLLFLFCFPILLRFVVSLLLSTLCKVLYFALEKVFLKKVLQNVWIYHIYVRYLQM